MSDSELVAVLAVSLGLGLLVGLQRERAGSKLGGVRTFPLITVLGTLCTLVSKELNTGWVVGAGLVALAAAMGVANYVILRNDEEPDAGITTEVAALVMYAVGAYAAVGALAAALGVGVVTAVLLHAKGTMHEWAGRMGEKDMRAVLLFAAITFVVLPVLPNESYGPWGVWNPRNIWLMVVLVVGMSLAGYVLYKVFGAGAGSALSGLLGGLISSTATTVTAARRMRGDPRHTGPALLVIMVASCVVYGRVLTEIAVAAPEFFPTAVWPVGGMMAVSAMLAGAVWVSTRKESVGLPPPENPTELRSALVFAGLYALVLLAVEAGQVYLGDRGVFAVAAVSGLTDMDAITLSTSRLVARGELEAGPAWRAILLAAVSNLAFKAGIVGVLGGRPLMLRVVGLYAVQALAAGAMAWMW